MLVLHIKEQEPKAQSDIKAEALCEGFFQGEEMRNWLEAGAPEEWVCG